MAPLAWLVLAQGITTAAIDGRITQVDGTPVAAATVRIVNQSNGRRWEIVTGANGAYLLEDAGVGGPYHIDVQAVGFARASRSGMVLALGQRFDADFTLQPLAIELAPVDVTAAADPVLNPARTSPTEIVSRERIEGTPNLGRDFLSLITLSPHAMVSVSSGTAPTGGITIAGQNRLYSSFQIDGGLNHDLYRGRLPGRETLERPISIEALEQIQILPAPFDVRLGTFAGGLVNALTKSGTNTVTGAAFGYLSDETLARHDLNGDVIGDFTASNYGLSVGGPIARDRLHYFMSLDVRNEVVPDPGPLITDTAGGADLAQIGISYASALRFQTLLRDTFNLDPGTLGPVNGQVHTTDIFGKLTVQLGTNNQLELSHHYAQGERRGFLSRTRNFYFLSSADQSDPATLNASRLIWTSLLSRQWSSELILSGLWLDDSCEQPSSMALHVRANPTPGRQLVAGPQGTCPAAPRNAVVQDGFEVTENLTRAFGAHVVTLGIHGEALRFQDHWLQNATGQWNFASLDALQAGTPARYTRTVPGANDDGFDIRARHLAAYTQDRWTLVPRLAVTFGVRLDAPLFPVAVPTNPTLRDSLGIDTGRLPSGVLAWSPRIGFNYDMRGDGRSFLRGGVGYFSGRVPYQWVGNAYHDNGLRELFLDCAGAAAPPFDPTSQPAACRNGIGPVPRLSYFDPEVRFPQNLKLALGVDHVLPTGAIGTIDVLYTHALTQLYLTDANLLPPGSVAGGEGNRPMYGTITCTTACSAAPARRVSGVGQVVRVTNSSGDKALSVTVQLRKQFGDRVQANGFYAYSRVQDRMSVINPLARANLENTPLNGTINNRPLRTSYFEIPHRVQLGATVRLPWRATAALLYTGSSGTPYTHMTVGDANADGIGGVPLLNDPIYVPRDRGDIALGGSAAHQDSVWTVLDDLIRAEPCLSRQRGRVLERNSCRNPWFGVVNARVMKTIPTRAGEALELTADVYNVLNLINSHWGQYRITIRDPWVQTLQLVGYDAANGRGIYDYLFRGARRIQDLESRWQMQVGLRYVF